MRMEKRRSNEGLHAHVGSKGTEAVAIAQENRLGQSRRPRGMQNNGNLFALRVGVVHPQDPGSRDAIVVGMLQKRQHSDFSHLSGLGQDGVIRRGR